ncbi:MAG: 50S ribosomal protein L20 [Mycoplasmataceae bacterium]|jgi:large subunit ribosomal protein L20|nr:50S ribosomal protein L20 [Mycoplasmataceae bacterium]
MRVKGGQTTRQRRKATKRRVEGAWGTKHTSYKIARQTLLRSADYAYRDRKARKRDFRKLWNARINAAVRELGYNYSTFINALHKAKIAINRKMLSELAINNPEEFKTLVEKVMKK